MTELQNFVNNFGFGISLENLVSKAYFQMKALGFDACIVNGRYLEVNVTTYLFSKSRKAGGWIIKEI